MYQVPFTRTIFTWVRYKLKMCIMSKHQCGSYDEASVKEGLLGVSHWFGWVLLWGSVPSLTRAVHLVGEAGHHSELHLVLVARHGQQRAARQLLLIHLKHTHRCQDVPSPAALVPTPSGSTLPGPHHGGRQSVDAAQLIPFGLKLFSKVFLALLDSKMKNVRCGWTVSGLPFSRMN